jgi:peptidoglycan/LPS O-acetylase OafA/YrhL
MTFECKGAGSWRSHLTEVMMNTKIHAASEPRARIRELDGLRGIAVSLVLIWHFFGAVIDQNLGLWAKYVYWITIFGRTGVDLFFVLSGFLITGIILDRKQGFKNFLMSFYIRRVLRIVPSYLVLVVVFWIIVFSTSATPAFNADTPIWYHLLFIQNVWMTLNNIWGPGAISVTWSVAIEEQYYIVFPFVALLLSRDRLVKLLCFVAIFSCFFRLWVWLRFGNPFAMYVFTLSRLDGLAFGGLLACFWRTDAFINLSNRNKKTISNALVGFVCVIPFFLFSIKKDLPMNMALWGHTYLTLLYSSALLFILINLGSTKLSWLRDYRLAKLGALSYTVYLVHPLFISSVFLLWGKSEKLGSIFDLLLFLFAFLLCLMYSFVRFTFLEKPATNFGKRYVY